MFVSPKLAHTLLLVLYIYSIGNFCVDITKNTIAFWCQNYVQSHL